MGNNVDTDATVTAITTTEPSEPTHYRSLPERPWTFTGKCDANGFTCPGFDLRLPKDYHRDRQAFHYGELKNIVGLGNLKHKDYVWICLSCSTITPYVDGENIPCIKYHNGLRWFDCGGAQTTVLPCAFAEDVWYSPTTRAQYTIDYPYKDLHEFLISNATYPDRLYDVSSYSYTGMCCSSCTKRAGWFIDDTAHPERIEKELFSPYYLSSGLGSSKSYICGACWRYITRRFLRNIYMSVEPPISTSFRRLYTSDIIQKRKEKGEEVSFIDSFSSFLGINAEPEKPFICSWTCAACRGVSSYHQLYCIMFLGEGNMGAFDIIPMDILRYISHILCLLSVVDRVQSDKNDFCYDWCGLEYQATFISPSSHPYPEKFRLYLTVHH